MPHQTRITGSAIISACPACDRRQNRDGICRNPRCRLFDQDGQIARAREAALAEMRALLLHHHDQETSDD